MYGSVTKSVTLTTNLWERVKIQVIWPTETRDKYILYSITWLLKHQYSAERKCCVYIAGYWLAQFQHNLIYLAIMSIHYFEINTLYLFSCKVSTGLIAKKLFCQKNFFGMVIRWAISVKHLSYSSNYKALQKLTVPFIISYTKKIVESKEHLSPFRTSSSAFLLCGWLFYWSSQRML